ncbi:MAG TPA: hypothetical protein ENJ56_06790, partial [Anaerolineae bacterium]|nr:hypothetical protein [Anaerolineae bacterium]
MKYRTRLLWLLILLVSAVASTAAFADSSGSNELALAETASPSYFIIMLKDAPLATYTGNIRSFAATSPSVTGAKFDISSAASQAYQSYLLDAQDAVLANISNTLSRDDLNVRQQYTVAFNGFAVDMSASEAAELAKVDGIAQVFPGFTRYIETDVSPAFLGVDQIWSGAAVGANATITQTMGEGMVVGIIDTGINMDHPSFADVGDDGYDHTNPLGAGNYKGWCNPADPDFDAALVCNDKLIGVHSYPSSGDNPEDDNGHGSHTGSTTAGNQVDATLFGFTKRISGMAPHANIIAYDVCSGTGCQGDSILAAIDDAVVDGVDVINYSIGANASPNPWTEADEIAYLNATIAGVLPVTSAGNAGPGVSTVGSPAGAPWMMTVANMTHNRQMTNATVSVAGEAALQNIPTIQGDGTPFAASITGDLSYAGHVDAANVEGCNPFAAGTFTGKIALISRGSCTFATKSQNASDAGAIALIVHNNRPGQAFSMSGTDNVAIPAFMVDQTTGVAMAAAVDGVVKQATIAPVGAYVI